MKESLAEDLGVRRPIADLRTQGSGSRGPTSLLSYLSTRGGGKASSKGGGGARWSKLVPVTAAGAATYRPSARGGGKGRAKKEAPEFFEDENEERSRSPFVRADGGGSSRRSAPAARVKAEPASSAPGGYELDMGEASAKARGRSRSGGQMTRSGEAKQNGPKDISVEECLLHPDGGLVARTTGPATQVSK